VPQALPPRYSARRAWRLSPHRLKSFGPVNEFTSTSTVGHQRRQVFRLAGNAGVGPRWASVSAAPRGTCPVRNVRVARMWIGVGFTPLGARLDLALRARPGTLRTAPGRAACGSRAADLRFPLVPRPKHRAHGPAKRASARSGRIASSRTLRSAARFGQHDAPSAMMAMPSSGSRPCMVAAFACAAM